MCDKKGFKIRTNDIIESLEEKSWYGSPAFIYVIAKYKRSKKCQLLKRKTSTTGVRGRWSLDNQDFDHPKDHGTQV